MNRLAMYRVTLTFGRIEFSVIEEAVSEAAAIYTVQRYARAAGYSGQPTTIQSRRVSA